VPLKALKLALRSEDLELLSENDAYALASGWVASRPKREQKEAFSELVRCLRFHHMSPAFLTTMVLWSKRWADCPFLAQACSNAWMCQSLATSFSKVPHEHEAAHPFRSAKPSRVRAEAEAEEEDVTYTFEAEVSLAHCLPLRVDGRVHLRLGVPEGHMVSLYVARKAKDNAGPTVGLYVELTCPDLREMVEEEGPAETDTVGLSGPMAAVQIDACDTVWSFTRLFQINTIYGCGNVFKKPWDEVVREGSDSFPEGRMTVTVDIKFVADKHVTA
jgi:hypothetical protein